MQLGTMGVFKPITVLTALSVNPLRVLGSIQPDNSISNQRATGFQTLIQSNNSILVPNASIAPVAQIFPRTNTFTSVVTTPGQTTSQLTSIETSIVDDFEDSQVTSASSENTNTTNSTTSTGGTSGGTVAGGTTSGSGKSGCFSLESSFLEILEDEASIVVKPLSELQEGDKVVTGHTDGVPEFQVFGGDYYHRNQNQHFDFVKLTVENKDVVTLTRNHYIYVQREGKVEPIMAGSLRLGDQLIKNGQPFNIVQIQATHEKGAASPIMNSDQLEVNGFSVSTYSGLRLNDQDLLGYSVNSHIVDSAVKMTQLMHGSDALKPNQNNQGNVQAIGQNIIDLLED